jgi:cytochrome c peroxidase
MELFQQEMAINRFAIKPLVNKQYLFASLLFLSFFSLSYMQPFTDIRLKKSNEDLQLLGRYLFYDTRLSYNQTKSCASCHDPFLAFSDGYRTAVGADGYAVRRNTPSILNARYRSSFTWSDSSIRSFKQQLFFPFFNQHPKELGWENEAAILTRIKSIPGYVALFNTLFSKHIQPISLENIFFALTAFEESIVSHGSRYDAYLQGNKSVLSANEKAGMQLFFSAKLNCGVCHIWDEKNKLISPRFENTGLYNLGESGYYPPSDQGLFEITKNDFDMGKFRVPSLRNILLTAPYTHDGSVSTLDEMIEIYARGGRFIGVGEYKGDGSQNPYKSRLIKGFNISKQEKQNLILFLNCFTDTAYLKNKKLLFVALNK